MASLSGVFNAQQFTDAGGLANNYRLYTYASGTTTHKVAYTDAAAAVPHTYTSDGIGGQYIALNARGELPAPLFLLTGSYDLALKTPAGVTVWTRRATGIDDGSTTVAADLAAVVAGLAASTGAGLVGWLQTGTGAVARTVQSKLRDIVSAKDFGAVGDGTTDDSAAINAALAAVAISGAKLVFPPGTYLYSGTITVFFGMKICGASWQTTTLKFTNLAAIAIDFTLASVSDVAIVGITLDGTNKATRTERCMRFSGTQVSSFFMDEVRFTNWASPVNSAVIHITSTAKLFASEWGTLRFASGSYNGSAIRDDGGGPCLKINNLYTGNADGSIDYVVGVVGSNLKIGVWNVGGATGVLMQHRGTSLSSLDIDIINYETSASPAHVVYLADTQFRLGALALAGAGQPVYGVSIQETGIGDKYIGPVHGSKAATTTGHVQINTSAAPTGQVYYAGSAANVVNSIAGSPQLSTVFALRENQPVSHQYAVAEGRITTTDATSTGVVSYSLPVGATANIVVYISGVQSDGSNRASYVRRATVYRLGSANAALQGAVVDEYTSESNAAWDVTVDVTSTNARARVIGVAATTIKWNARMEVSYVLESN